jgi:hypothetical protein
LDKTNEMQKIPLGSLTYELDGKSLTLAESIYAPQGPFLSENGTMTDIGEIIRKLALDIVTDVVKELSTLGASEFEWHPSSFELAPSAEGIAQKAAVPVKASSGAATRQNFEQERNRTRELSEYERTEEMLLEAVQSARRRLGPGQAGRDEYAVALRRFNDLFLRKITPTDHEPRD